MKEFSKYEYDNCFPSFPRKIDRLGRTTIPKEICNLLRIQTDDVIEFIVNSNKLVLVRKYSPISFWSEISHDLVDAIYSEIKGLKFAAVADCDYLVSYSGEDKDKIISDINYCTLADLVNKAIGKHVFSEVDINNEMDLNLMRKYNNKFTFELVTIKVKENNYEDMNIGIIIIASSSDATFTDQHHLVLKVYSGFLKRRFEYEN